MVMPEPIDARERKLEVLRSKPIPDQVGLRARFVALFAVVALVVTCLGVPPLVVASLHFGAPWWQPPALWLALVAGAFTAVLFWLTSSFWLAQHLGVERLRRYTQLMLLFAILAVMSLSLGLPFLRSGPASLAHHPIAPFLPSTWFARLALGATPLEWLGVAALLAVGLLLQGRIDVDRCYERALEVQATTAPGRQHSVSRLLLRFGLRPLLARTTFAVADLTLEVWGREELSRMRGLAPRVVQLLLFGWIVWTRDPFPAIPLLAGYGFFCLAEGLSGASQCSHAAASWVLLASPLPPRRALAGLRLAVLLRQGWLPTTLLGGALLLLYPIAVATILLAAHVLTSLLLVSFLLLLIPRMPLSTDQTAWPGLAGLMGLNLTGMVSTGAYAVLVLITSSFGMIGLMLGGCSLLPLAAAAALCQWGASRRARAWEQPL